MWPEITPAERLIVALDFDNKNEALELVDRLGETVSFYKVGWQLFMGSHFDAIEELGERGKKVFLDLKMEDIGATIEGALRSAPTSVDFVELMSLKGTSNIVRAARSGTRNGRPKFLMLTVLSSVGDEDIQEMFGDAANLDDIVRTRAKKALEAECDGLIASGDSVAKLRGWFPEKAFLIVTPAIRPKGSPVDDQKRVLTPFEAIQDGADYLVVGRPIRKAPDPLEAARSIISEIEMAIDERGPSASFSVSHENDLSSPRQALAPG